MRARKLSFRLLLALICAVSVLAATVACSSEKEETKIITSESTSTPDCAYNVTDERIHEVRVQNDGLFWRQPNVFRVGEGHFRDENGNWLDTIGIVVGVTKKVDQNTLPAKDRIPDCIDGIPVNVQEEELPIMGEEDLEEIRGEK